MVTLLYYFLARYYPFPESFSSQP